MGPHPMFPGVKRASSGALYYNNDDVNMITAPMQDKCVGYNLSPEELRKYFGVAPERMPQLPEYLIVPRLHNQWNSGRSNEKKYSWWDMTGEVVVYKPVKWIPVVKELSTIPYNTMEVHFEKIATSVRTTEIYGNVSASFSLSTGGGFFGLRVQVYASTELSASYKKNYEVKEEITQKAKLGTFVVKEVAMGMQLQVERVFERSVKLYLNDKSRGNSLTWDGPNSWETLWVASSDLREVEGLQFHPITMTGTGHSRHLYLQVLPVFDDKKKLKNLHLGVKSKGWQDWYAYRDGVAKAYGNGTKKRVEILPVLDNPQPMGTFIPTNIEDGDKR